MGQFSNSFPKHFSYLCEYAFRFDLSCSFCEYPFIFHCLHCSPSCFDPDSLLLAHLWLGLSCIYCISANKSFSSPKTSSRKPYTSSKQQERQKHSVETTINLSPGNTGRSCRRQREELSTSGGYPAVLAHGPSFGRTPGGSPDFVAYPVPKAYRWHCLGTCVPRSFGCRTLHLKSQSSADPWMQPYSRALVHVWPGHLHGAGCLSDRAIDTGPPTAVPLLPLPSNPGWRLWGVCLGQGFAFTLPIKAGVFGVCVWVWVLAFAPPIPAGVCRVCVCVRVLPLPRHCWLGLWCVCSCAGFAFTPAPLAWGCGVCEV